MMKRLLFIFIHLTIAHWAFSQIEDTTYQTIEEVTITADKEKKIVFDDPKYYIVDFSIADSHALLLMRNLQTYYLYELDEEMNFHHKLELKFDADYLFDDCFGNTYVISKDSAYAVYGDSEGLFLTEIYPRRQYLNAMMRCAGSTSEKVIFEKKARYNQDQTYYTVDIDSGDRKIIYEMKDNEISRSMREAIAELYLLEHLSRDRVAGRSGELGNLHASQESMKQEVNAQRIKNASYDRATFVESHILQPKYNPLFTIDDTIYVFDHYQNRIQVISQSGAIVRSIPISYHLSKHWNEQIYLDRRRKEFYAVHERRGVQYLIRLDLSGEAMNSSSKITDHAYPKKVMVRNGYAYYTYKQNFDANLNKLYRQKL